MAKIINPFIVTGKIAPEYFCDRVSESARLVKSVTNGNNLVVISPRRMGKTGLIQFCYVLLRLKPTNLLCLVQQPVSKSRIER